MPKRLFPVFRDRDELPLSSDLGTAIQDALRASRYLIVICSPFAAKSRWVNEEVRHFKSVFGEDRILAIIASGTPNAEDYGRPSQEECFPAALRYRLGNDAKLTEERCEPIGGDLRKGGDGWRACLLKAVAGITGIGLASFTKRDAVRTRRKRMLLAVSLLLALCTSFAFWDFNRLKTSHYEHLTERWGVPTGALELRESEQANRGSIYLVETSRGRVRRTVFCNGSGFPVEDPSAPYNAAIREITYGENGNIQSVALRSAQGYLVAHQQFSRPREDAAGTEITIEYVGASEDNPRAADGESDRLTFSSASVERRRYQEDGWLSKTTYLDAYRQPVVTSSGVSGLLFRNDSSGLPIELVFIGPDGTPTEDGNGIQKLVLSRDAKGRVLSRSHFGNTGQRKLGPDGFHRSENVYDASSNEIEVRTYGTNDLPILDRNLVAVAKREYDRRGGEILRSYYGVDGKPTLRLPNNNAAVRYQRNKSGDIVARHYLGTGGEPVMASGGFASIRYEFDEYRNVRLRIFQGLNGKPINLARGYASTSYTYDEKGHLVESAFYSSSGAPVEIADNYAMVRWRWDDRGNIVSRSYLDAQGELVDSDAAFAEVQWRYDERGNEIERSHLDSKGSLVMSTLSNRDEDGKYITWKRDGYGQSIEQAYRRVDGTPSPPIDFAKVVTSHDSIGNILRRQYSAPANNGGGSDSSVVSILCEYDERGRLIEQSFLGKDQSPMLHEDGFVYVRYTYDPSGKVVTQSHFGANGLPVLRKGGDFAMEYSYDQRGGVIQRAHFDKAGNPVMTSLGFARVVGVRDAKGRLVEERYLDTKGNPVLNKYGYSFLRRVFDPRGKAEATYFDLAGRQLSENTSRPGPIL